MKWHRFKINSNFLEKSRIFWRNILTYKNIRKQKQTKNTFWVHWSKGSFWVSNSCYQDFVEGSRDCIQVCGLCSPHCLHKDECWWLRCCPFNQLPKRHYVPPQEISLFPLGRIIWYCHFCKSKMIEYQHCYKLKPNTCYGKILDCCDAFFVER